MVMENAVEVVVSSLRCWWCAGEPRQGLQALFHETDVDLFHLLALPLFENSREGLAETR
jgi:hypothetical protein